MKTRFTTIDICAVVTELQEQAVGLRLTNIYDVDNKTYLLKLIKPDTKKILLLESGIRMHLSEFDWPKNNFPSGFAMKLRKHLRGRRLVSVRQLGIDRIVDLQFGSNDAAFHLIVELYDRGNIALTDCNYVILNLLRYRKPASSTSKDDSKEDNNDVRIAVHEQYPIESARPHGNLIDLDKLLNVLREGKPDVPVKRILNAVLPYGISTIEHCMCVAGFNHNAKIGKDFNIDEDGQALHTALQNGENLLRLSKTVCSPGYIIQKIEGKSGGDLITNIEFQPHLFHQHKDLPHQECSSFNKAVDEFFGALVSQRSDLKALQRERAALKKLENVRKDHESRINGLRAEQENDYIKATLIEANLAHVDKAIRVICGAVANQLDWKDIDEMVKEAQSKGDEVACMIRSLKLNTNSFMMALSMPDYNDDSSSDDEDDDGNEEKKRKVVKIEIDLSVSAYGNAQRYYTMKRQAANKEQRTHDASHNALKSAEKKTTQTLKEAAAVHNIQKARKVFWFEKFIWFISTENYLIIGGRDAQQNEILVKRYLRAGDVYVHADLHGATSCIIKNNTPGSPIPPKTLNEAGTMAICHSAAWDAKVITSAWWVSHDQVSKTAPSGEYLTTGSFLIRGKKNYLPPSYLVYGFGFLFKVDETCVWRHKDERRVKNKDDDDDISDVTTSASRNHVIQKDDEELKEEDEEGEESDKFAFPDTQLKVEYKTTSVTTEAPLDTTTTQQHDEDTTQQRGEDTTTQHDEDTTQQHGEDTTTHGEDTTQQHGEDTTQQHGEVTTTQQHDDGATVTNNNQQQGNKTRLSAKERRDLRKMKKNQGVAKPENPPQPSSKPIEKPPTTTSNNKQEQVPPPKRGQKKKLKKIKQKYGEQDEEERRMVMDLLQSAKAPKSKDKKGANHHTSGKYMATLNKKKQDEEIKNASGEGKSCEECPDVDQPSSDAAAHVATGGGKPHDVKEEKEERRNEEAANSDEEREMALKTEHLEIEPVGNLLETLTAIPHPEDHILFAIPVCAPYNAMQNYKFKVKLTPGANKKGKATKTALSMFQLSRETTQQEKDHLKSVKDYDLSRNVPGKVKLSAPNLQGLKQKTKNNKKR